MNLEIGSLFVFAIIMVSGPGPANMVLLTVGARFGLKRSLNFMLGVIASKQLIIWPIGLGLISLIKVFPNFVFTLQILSCAYIIWLAWQISKAKIVPSEINSRIPGFFSGILVHPLNPKAWAMVTASFTNFTNTNFSELSSILVVALVFLLVQFICHPMWVVFGVFFSKIIQGHPYETRMMQFLGVLIIASLATVLLSG